MKLLLGMQILLLSLLFNHFSLAQSDLQDLVLQLKKLDSPKSEREIGYKTAAKILGSAPLVEDSEITSYVNLVGKVLVKNLTGQKYQWTFAVIQSDDINAFSAPGGFVILTKGLLKKLNNEDELAAVLAHEIAHVRLRHYMKVAKKQIMAEYTMKSLNTGNDDAQLEAMAEATTLVLARGIDKQSEFDADRESVITLAKAGYDPSAMADVLTMLEKNATGGGKNMSFLLATHPHPSQRLQALGACCAEAFSNMSEKNAATVKRFDSILKARI